MLSMAGGSNNEDQFVLGALPLALKFGPLLVLLQMLGHHRGSRLALRPLAYGGGAL